MTQREVALPSVFGQWAGRVSYVQVVTRDGTKFKSACPACGGIPHPDGTWPDRALWWLTSKNGSPMGFCTRCRKTFWPDTISDEEKAEARVYVQSQLDANARKAAELAAAFRESHKWEMYHDSMTETGRQKWLKRGVPTDWQDYWLLGTGTYNVRVNDAWVASPTLTIPLFDKEWTCLNVKHRLEIADDKGKYRPEIAGVGALMFRCDPSATLEGRHVIVVEGEIKAGVCWSRIACDDFAMVGIPGTNPAPQIIAELKQAESVTLVLDPGAEKQAHELAGQIGKGKCRVLIPPFKIDDGVLAANMTAGDIKALLATARMA